MRLSSSRLAAIVVAALAIPLLGITAFVRAEQRALPIADGATYARFWEKALAYDAFVGGDTARHAQWLANGATAIASMPAQIERARAIPGRWHVLVVAESWCGDAVNSVPYLARVAAADPSIELRLLRKRDAARLLRAHLLDGRRATPLVLLLDDRFTERASWVERPVPLATLVRQLEPRVSDDSLGVRARAWYAADSGRTSVSEILSLLESVSR